MDTGGRNLTVLVVIFMDISSLEILQSPRLRQRFADLFNLQSWIHGWGGGYPHNGYNMCLLRVDWLAQILLQQF